MIPPVKLVGRLGGLGGGREGGGSEGGGGEVGGREGGGSVGLMNSVFVFSGDVSCSLLSSVSAWLSDDT